MITFYPGPSKVFPQIPKYVKKALKKGIISANHRSQEFQKLYKSTEELLKKKLKIPSDYKVYFVSSATECWEIITQSFIREKSHHLYNGAFGEKWHKYTQRIKPQAVASPFELQDLPVPSEINAEAICITQNETSNGTQIPNAVIQEFKNLNSQALIAVDATSSMAGIWLDFAQADIWYASVQKCFGLPAGMGILICSPKALQVAVEMNELDHYNSILFIDENARQYQTHYTPNILNIYLLYETLRKNPGIKKTDKMISRRQAEWVNLVAKYDKIKLLVENKDALSKTVITIETEAGLTEKIKENALKKGIILGNGYGKWKPNTFRIANFPAITDKEMKKLKSFLDSYLQQ